MSSKNRPGRSKLTRLMLLGLFLVIPTQMGGCPEFQNASVTAIETAMRGVLDAALDLAFDQFRSGRAS